jgi:histidine triad (HIT) family protein
MVEPDCIFCDIINGRKPATVVYQDDQVMIFKDILPRAPVHLLVIPKKHIRSLNDLTAADRETVTAMLFSSQTIAARLGFANQGYRLIFNVESGGGQDVFHLHLHLMAGW